MPDDKKTIQPINAPFDDVAKAMLRTQTKPEEITSNTNRISVLAPKSTSKEITRVQGSLDLEVERTSPGTLQWWSDIECGVGKGRFVTEYSYAELIRDVQRQPDLFAGVFDFDPEMDAECGLWCGEAA